MEKIKIRFWDNDQKGFHYVTITKRIYERTLANFKIGVLSDPELMLENKDINNKEIYEGDICLVGLYKMPAVVVIKDGCAYYHWDITGDLLIRDSPMSEVIGNIHESKSPIKRYK